MVFAILALVLGAMMTEAIIIWVLVERSKQGEIDLLEERNSNLKLTIEAYDRQRKNQDPVATLGLLRSMVNAPLGAASHRVLLDPTGEHSPPETPGGEAGRSNNGLPSTTA